MAPGSPFPRPPTTVTDTSSRKITVAVVEEPEDWREPVVAMYRRFDPEDRAQGIPPTGEAAIRDWVDRILGGGINLVATHDERVVGHATLVPDTPDVEPPAEFGSIRWELAIFVEHEYQRSGIGRELLEHLLGHAEELGVEHVWLTVERWNTAAIALYHSVGFEDMGAERFEHEMELELGDSNG